MKLPQFKISGWYILIFCLIGTFLSSHGLSMYGTVHWDLLTSTYKLKAHTESIALDKEALKLIDKNENLKTMYENLPIILDKVETSGWKLMGQASTLRLSGLIVFLLSIFSFFCSPRWVGFIALPFGIYSLNLSMIIM